MNKLSSAAAFAAGCFAFGSATAEETSFAATNWNGFYVGASLTSSKYGHSGTWDSGDPAGPFSLDPMSKANPGAEIFAGYLFTVGNNFVVGPEASISISKNDSFATSEPATRGPDTHSVRNKKLNELRLRFGWINENRMVYAGVGRSEIEATYRLEEAFSATVTDSSDKEVATSASLGLEIQSKSNLRYRAEISHIFVDETYDLSGLPDGDPGDFYQLDGITKISLGVSWAF